MICNLDNYKYYIHYGEWINSQIMVSDEREDGRKSTIIIRHIIMTYILYRKSIIVGYPDRPILGI